MKKVIVFFSITTIILLTSCAGGRMHLQSDNLKYPVTTTCCFYKSSGSDYSLLNEFNYEVIENFELQFKKQTILWTLVNIDNDPDLGEELNKIIEEKKGDAIVDLVVIGGYTSYGPLSLLPFMPSDVRAIVRGKVVKFK